MTALTEAHDYYIHTRGVWRLLHIAVAREGRAFTIRNRVTGTVVDESVLSVLGQQYATRRVAAAALQEWAAIFESFTLDLIGLWLRAYPKSLEGKQIGFSDVLNAPDKDAIVDLVVERQINDIGYRRLAEWFKFLNDRAKLNCPTADEIERLAEIKATRDVFVHSDGVANATYLSKSGSRARCAAGEQLDLPPAYLRESWVLMRKVVADVAAAASERA